jgi:hypothetical protein
MIALEAGTRPTRSDSRLDELSSKTQLRQQRRLLRAGRCDRYAHCPELNDVLHLQCKGITEIKSLEVRPPFALTASHNNSAHEPPDLTR